MRNPRIRWDLTLRPSFPVTTSAVSDRQESAGPMLLRTIASRLFPVAVLTATVASAQATGRPPSSPVREDLRRTIQGILDKGVADSAFPGAIAVIGNHSGAFVTVAAGHLDWAPSPVPDRHTLWDLASLTKVVGFTSAMMQLVE